MGIIKRFYYVLKNKYRQCRLCDGNATLELAKIYDSCLSYEGLHSDSHGNIDIKCPACNGCGVIWG